MAEDHDGYSVTSPDGKRKRFEGPPTSDTAKRRMTDEGCTMARTPLAKANSFARKTGVYTRRGPFMKSLEMSKSLY